MKDPTQERSIDLKLHKHVVITIWGIQIMLSTRGHPWREGTTCTLQTTVLPRSTPYPVSTVTEQTTPCFDPAAFTDRSIGHSLNESHFSCSFPAWRVTVSTYLVYNTLLRTEYSHFLTCGVICPRTCTSTTTFQSRKKGSGLGKGHVCSREREPKPLDSRTGATSSTVWSCFS